MKHITPTPGKMCFSFAIKKRPLPTAGAKPWILYVNLKCTHSRKLGALYQFVVRKPDRVAHKYNVVVLHAFHIDGDLRAGALQNFRFRFFLQVFIGLRAPDFGQAAAGQRRDLPPCAAGAAVSPGAGAGAGVPWALPPAQPASANASASSNAEKIRRFLAFIIRCSFPSNAPANRRKSSPRPGARPPRKSRARLRE